jgi:hypothetical protein
MNQKRQKTIILQLDIVKCSKGIPRSKKLFHVALYSLLHLRLTQCTNIAKRKIILISFDEQGSFRSFRILSFYFSFWRQLIWLAWYMGCLFVNLQAEQRKYEGEEATFTIGNLLFMWKWKSYSKTSKRLLFDANTTYEHKTFPENGVSSGI